MTVCMHTHTTFKIDKQQGFTVYIALYSISVLDCITITLYYTALQLYCITLYYNYL